MKKIVLLSAAALLLAGCAAPATSPNSAPSVSSPAAAPTASAVASDFVSSPAATTSSATASAAALSTADTCAAVAAVMKANQPAAGSSDNKQYWATVSEQLHPIAEKASTEVKPSVEGLFTYFDTRAKNWGTPITKEQGAQGTQAFDGISKACKPASK